MLSYLDISEKWGCGSYVWLAEQHYDIPIILLMFLVKLTKLRGNGGEVICTVYLKYLHRIRIFIEKK